MKKGKFKKKFVSIMLLIFLIVSFTTPPVYAQSNIFIGVDNVEVAEHTTFDLLKGVYAQNEKGEKLRVSVASILCDNKKIDQNDNSDTLLIGSTGTTYIVNYKAVSSDFSEEYEASRKIISVKDNDNSEINNYSGENIAELVQDTTSPGAIKVCYANGIHYVEDKEDSDSDLIVYGMNNELRSPNGNDAPYYKDSILNPSDFKSEDDYKECSKRLCKILYEGYPYNGEKLFKIVEDSERHIPTVEEFNDMLIPLPVLKDAFPELADYDFSYNDWLNKNEKHLSVLSSFINEVLKLKLSNKETSNGLTADEICSMPFYKAAYCMVLEMAETPLEIFSIIYEDSYYLTKEQAYLSTQCAIWILLNEYNIPNNNLTQSVFANYQLAKVLYEDSNMESELLEYKPDVSKIRLEGNLTFDYNPSDGMWHSGKLMIEEPAGYNGVYKLTLPEGITIVSKNLSQVFGNSEFELISDKQPESNEVLEIEADFNWLKELRKYTPVTDTKVDGNKFENMVGEVVRNEDFSLETHINSDDVPSDSPGNQPEDVPGDKPNNTPSDNPEGQPGDIPDDKPNNTPSDNPEGQPGDIPDDKPSNTPSDNPGNQPGNASNGKPNNHPTANKADLIISKVITGEAGDKTKKFTFEINIESNKGAKLNGTYKYLGSVKKGYENESTAPENGELTFVNGKAQIELSHGQQIIIKNLPRGYTYTVVEKEQNQDGYTTTYNNVTKSAVGSLDKDSEVDIVNDKEKIPENNIPGNLGPNESNGSSGSSKPDSSSNPNELNKTDKPNDSSNPNEPDRVDKPNNSNKPSESNRIDKSYGSSESGKLDKTNKPYASIKLNKPIKVDGSSKANELNKVNKPDDSNKPNEWDKVDEQNSSNEPDELEKEEVKDNYNSEEVLSQAKNTNNIIIYIIKLMLILLLVLILIVFYKKRNNK